MGRVSRCGQDAVAEVCPSLGSSPVHRLVLFFVHPARPASQHCGGEPSDPLCLWSIASRAASLAPGALPLWALGLGPLQLANTLPATLHRPSFLYPLAGLDLGHPRRLIDGLIMIAMRGSRVGWRGHAYMRGGWPDGAKTRSYYNSRYYVLSFHRQNPKSPKQLWLGFLLARRPVQSVSISIKIERSL